MLAYLLSPFLLIQTLTLIELIHAISRDKDLKIGEWRGNQLPPPNTGYYDQFNQCGVANACTHQDGRPECSTHPNRIRKRSILRPAAGPAGRSYPFSNGDDYIYNGDDVNDFTYPWVGRFQWNKLDVHDTVLHNGQRYLYYWQTYCTVSLISSRHVLGALHCFESHINMNNAINETEIDMSHKNKIRLLFGVHEAFTYSNHPLLDHETAFTTIRHIVKLLLPAKPVSGELDFVMMQINDVTFKSTLRPVCLPIGGTPVSDEYVAVGYGLVGKNHDTGEIHHKPKLQELRDLEVGHAELVYAAHVQVRFPRDNQSSCPGDSGGPLMWMNTNSRYTIIGTLIGGLLDGQQTCPVQPGHSGLINVESIYSRVSYYMEWIIRKMKPQGESTMCLHPLCKRPEKVTRRTWMLQDGKGTVPILMAPCGYIMWQQGEKYICPIDITAERLKKFSEYEEMNTQHKRKFKYEECEIKSNNACPNGTQWDANNFLDELTSGSFIQNRYTGEDPPDSAILPQPDRPLQNPHHTLCDVNAQEGGHVQCPVKNTSVNWNGYSCIPSESICDGLFDCPDGWDESPHFCIGKCDYWNQFTYNGLAYSDNYGDEHVHNYASDDVPSQSAKACREACAESECTNFNWYGNEPSSRFKEGPICQNFKRFKFPNGIDKAVESRTIFERYTIRGPKECKGMYDGKGNNWCVPTRGVSFRSGIYFIQAFNGQFLADINGRPTVNSSYYDNINFIKYTIVKGNGLSENPAEWRLKFFGKSGNLYDNYFQIMSGFSVDGHGNPQLLTATKNENEISLKPPVPESSSVTQKWFMMPTRSDHGLMEVKIFAKFGSERHFLSLNKNYVNKYGDREYHIHLDHKDPWYNAALHTPEAHHAQSIVEQTTEAEYRLGQTFRMFECAFFGVQLPGIPDTGIKRYRELTRPKELGGEAEIKRLTSDLNVGYLPSGNLTYHDKSPVAISENIFLKLFGISHLRYLYMIILSQNGHSDFADRIAKVMAESVSIFDYAGRMRIAEKQFKIMFNFWKAYMDGSEEIPLPDLLFSEEKKRVAAFLTRVKTRQFLKDPRNVP